MWENPFGDGSIGGNGPTSVCGATTSGPRSREGASKIAQGRTSSEPMPGKPFGAIVSWIGSGSTSTQGPGRATADFRAAGMFAASVPAWSSGCGKTYEHPGLPAMNTFVIVLSAVVSYTLNAVLVHIVGGRAPLDVPNQRSLHTRPVPRIGGVGIVAGLSAGLLVHGELGIVVGVVLVLAGVSLVDDWSPMPAPARLAVHLGASAAFCVLTVRAGPIVQVVLIIAMGWMTNLYNFMDGSDGLAGGMAVFGFGAYSLAAVLAGDGDFAVVCACVAAAALAFLRFNFHPASIFMGDVGSIPMGFLAGALGVLGVQSGLWPWWFPAVIFAPFIVDASVTLLRRALRGEKIWQAHRSHYYQRLVLMGWSHRRTALAEYALMGFTGLVALAALEAAPIARFVLLAMLGFVYGVLAILVDRRWQAVSSTQSPR